MNQTTLVVDAGNTSIKLGIFHNRHLHEVVRFSLDQLGEMKTFLMEHRFSATVFSSVLSEKNTKWIAQLLEHPVRFSSSMDLPFEHTYESMETLGADRLANVVAAHAMVKGPSLIIDIGTCLKFDVISAEGIYLGGSISPGIHLRYKALNAFTGNLPLLDTTSTAFMLGNSTSSCMEAGVMQGIQGELNYFVSYYQLKYSGLTIFVTGGDAHYFDFQSKNNTFVEPNLTLYGLFYSIHKNK